MGLVVLDTCVVAELPGLNARGQLLRDWVADRKRQGHELVVVPQVIAEGERLREPGADARLVAIASWCDGVLGHDASEILRRELVVEDPAGEFRRQREVQGLFRARRHRERESFQEFLRAQVAGYAELDGHMPDFARHLAGVGKYRMVPFAEFVAGRWRDLFRVLVRYCVGKGYVPGTVLEDRELERLWDRARAFRLAILLRIANEYRIAGRKGKLTGSMKDVRVLFESAYADEFVTMDKELYACGKMLNVERLVEFPKFVKWPLAG